MRAVIFDLDDTLISEKEYIKSGYRHIAEILSDRYEKDPRELYVLLVELLKVSPENVFNRLLDNLDITYTKDYIMTLVKEYRNHLPTINFFDDVFPCLEILKKEGIKVGVITDGFAISQRKKLYSLGAEEYFDSIIVSDELGRQYWKPHPKPFEVIKDTLNVEYDEMIYVGDNPKKDFYISSIYPIKTIRLYRENGVYTSADYYKNVKEEIEIHSLEELIDYI